MLLVRAEGNSIIGLGHLMRTMSIASCLIPDTEIVYLCTGDESISLIQERGFRVIKLTHEAFSLEEAEEILGKGYAKNTAILIDSYQVSDEYIEQLKKKYVVAYMDDLIEHPYPADVIINYNTYATEHEYANLYHKSACRTPELIIGGQFIPLRSEFTAGCSTENSNESSGEKVKILITTGGGDQDNYAGIIAENLLKLGLNIELNVVCGAVNPNYPMLMQLSSDNSSMQVHRNVKNMSALMRECDMAISAGGSTCYELCAMGVPFVVFAYADNQLRILSSLAEKRAALSAGFADNVSKQAEVVSIIVAEAVKLINSKALREEVAANARKITDGSGARKLANELIRITSLRERA